MVSTVILILDIKESCALTITNVQEELNSQNYVVEEPIALQVVRKVYSVKQATLSKTTLHSYKPMIVIFAQLVTIQLLIHQIVNFVSLDTYATVEPIELNLPVSPIIEESLVLKVIIVHLVQRKHLNAQPDLTMIN